MPRWGGWGTGLGGRPWSWPAQLLHSLPTGGHSATPSGGSSVSSSSISSASLDALYTGSSSSELGPSCSPTPPPVPHRGAHVTATQAQPPPSKVPGSEAPAEDVAGDGLEALGTLSLGTTEGKEAETVPKTIGAELMELVRRNTGLSHALCRVAIGVVVGHIQACVPASSPVMEQVLLSLVEGKVRVGGAEVRVATVLWLQGRKRHRAGQRAAPCWPWQWRETDAGSDTGTLGWAVSPSARRGQRFRVREPWSMGSPVLGTAATPWPAERGETWEAAS